MSARRFQRRPKNEEQSTRFLIVSEGAVTEREYIEEVKRTRRLRSTDVSFIPPGPTSPIEIVDKAIALRAGAQRTDAYDVVWCIFDVEAKVIQVARPNLAQGLAKAAQSNISVALSNPCFELWLLLHSEDRRAWISSEEVQRRCEALDITSNKHLVGAEALLQRYYDARGRAIQLDEQHLRDLRDEKIDQNPASNVYELIDSLYGAFSSRS